MSARDVQIEDFEIVRNGIGPIVGPGPWDREEAALGALERIQNEFARSQITDDGYAPAPPEVSPQRKETA